MKKLALLIYRLTSPLIDPIQFYSWFIWYFRFWRDFFKTRKNKKWRSMNLIDLYPQPQDVVKNTPFDAHYFYQQLWCFENILKNKPEKHLDVWSTYQMSGYISKITKTVFMDIRPIEANLKNLEVVDWSILNPPFENNSFNSISCLHVIEHIGLWRYGDHLDINWSEKACYELTKLLQKWWFLYVSVPIGRERICFNAHRVFNPKTIVEYFKDLELLEFFVVDDNKDFIQNTDYKNYNKLEYWCGMFMFGKR